MPQWTIISLSGCCQPESEGAAYHPLQWKYLQCLSQPCKSQSLGGESVQALKSKQTNQKTTQQSCSLKASDLRRNRLIFMPLNVKTRLWARCLLCCQFPKCDLLATNLTRLTSKFTRGQQQPKQLLKFVFWSTQAAFLATIKHRRMHLQREKQD